MSAPSVSMSQDQPDDGPEEGEIEDDEDDLTQTQSQTGSSSLSSPVNRRSSTASKSQDSYATPSSKTSYERDIRLFELRRARTSRRRGTGESKHVHSTDSYSRTKCKPSRAGSTQGKENRHVHRHRSPVHHRKGGHDKAQADFSDVSPLRRDSSLSSVDSEESPAMDRIAHYRSSRKYTREDRRRRKTSSSPDTYTPARHRMHHTSKCPLVKILRSVAKETRKVMDSENPSESSTLRQRLFNMGAVSTLPILEVKTLATTEATSSTSEEKILDSAKGKNLESTCKELQTLSTQTEEGVEEIVHVVNSKRQEPDVIILSDSDAEVINQSKENSVPLKSVEIGVNKIEPDVDKVEPIAAASPVIVEGDGDDDEDDDADIIRLRLLALKSKKNEPPPSKDADVLQLRLAALKTALIKKFQTRKRLAMKNNGKSTNEDPGSLDPIEEVAMPFSPASPDEVLAPVDMELAETDDETGSVHSIRCYSPSDPMPDCFSPSDPIPMPFSPSDSYPNCYSPSDPTGSPSHEPSLQDLLPPPPPPDVVFYLSDQDYDAPLQVANQDCFSQGNYFNHGQTFDFISPPPLPPYFQQLLAEIPDPAEVMHDVEQTTHIEVEEENSLYLSGEPSSLISQPLETPVKSNTNPENTDIENVITSVEAHTENELRTSIEENQSLSCSESTALSKPEPPSKNTLEDGKETNVPVTIQKNEEIRGSSKVVCLEEEEKLMRQRLLHNMAMKKESASRSKTENLTEAKSSQNKMPIIIKDTKQIQSAAKKIHPVNGVKDTKRASPLVEPLILKPNPVSHSAAKPSLGNENKKFVINLGKDSDSSEEDYSEAEALGRKCARNRINWILYLKANHPEMSTSAKKVVSAKVTKLPLGGNVKAKPSVKEKNGMKPFAENLADLENSVERFLKGVRSSHESSSKTSKGSSISSSATPVAVKHLPASQQEEYRKLKQQIEMLEKRQMAMRSRKQAPGTSCKGPLKNINSTNQISRQIVINSTVLSAHNSSKVLPGSDKPKGRVQDNSTKLNIGPCVQNSTQVSKNSNLILSKNVPKLLVPLKKPQGNVLAKNTGVPVKNPNQEVPSQKLTKVLNNPKKTQSLQPAVGILIQRPSVKVGIAQSTSIDKSVKVVQGTVLKKCDLTSVIKSNGSLSNVNNKRDFNGVQPSTQLKSNERPNQQALKDLESNFIVQRSNFNNQVAMLSRLLTNVDKSLEAQSHTSKEISSLIDKLCLAAGRWKAQDSTVTSLVQRVAQSQVELSNSHYRFIAASKSCAAVGIALHGVNYRVPVDKADTVRLQVKQVHEKTEDLAKRRTDEQAKKHILEKRAETCLIKLFSDFRGRNSSKVGNMKANPSSGVNQSLPKTTVKSCTTVSASKNTAAAASASKSSSELSKDMISVGKHSNCTNEQYSHQLSSVISRAKIYRMALGKIKSAKAVLNTAKRKQLSEGVPRSAKRLCQHPRFQDKGCRNSILKCNASSTESNFQGNPKQSSSNAKIIDEDCRHDLSDMDISTDGEDVERRFKESAVNTDVVDMSVSPDISLSPARNYKEYCNTNTDCTNSLIQKGLCKEKKSSTKPPKLQHVQPTKSKHPSGTTGSVLKEYISPLGGLNILSCSSNSKVSSQEGDLYAILCPYELNGKCQDSECRFKHQLQ